MYDTRNKGRIALIDTKRSAVIGFVDLVDTHEISSKEYALLHLVGKWENSSFQIDTSRTYYSYDFANPVKPSKSIKIQKNGRIWCEIGASLKVTMLRS